MLNFIQFKVKVNHLNNNLKIKFDLNCETSTDELSKIIIEPSPTNVNTNIGGLCGSYDKDVAGCSNFVNNICQNNPASLLSYWK